MDTSRIIRGVVSNGRYTVTAPIVKEDYGLYLQIEGVELPETYQVDFSNSENSGTSVTMIGNADGVLIPHQFIDSGKDVFAFLYHVGANYGRTVYKFRIPNKVRPDRTDDTPTPEQASVIDQAISALNTAVEQTAQDKANADASAQSAQGYAEQAESARDTAQTYANNAQTSANNASASASQASASASASAQSASQSAQIKADVEDLADDAQSYAESALIASQASVTARDTAQGYANSASASAQSASTSASNASASANTASTKASEASTSAQTASTKASESAQSATSASQSAQTAEQAKTASQTAQGLAESARDTAVSAKTDAESARDDAETARDEAQQAVASISGALDDKAPIITDTASGAIASFSDGANDLPLKSLVVDINPIQDLSNGDPSPENICPISGWTEVDVEQRGVNVWGEEWELGIFNANGEPSIATDRIRSKNFCPCVPNTEYYFVIPSRNMRIYFYNENREFLDYYGYWDTSRIFTTPSNAYFFKILGSAAYGTTYNHDISINYPSTDHSYHPYTGRSITINLGQTVYGGKLDVLSGELVIDRAHIDLATLRGWGNNMSGQNSIEIRYPLTGKKEGRTNIISNMLKTGTETSAVDSAVFSIRGYPTSSIIAVKVPKTVAQDPSEVVKWIANNHPMACYELAEPITIQLTPNQVNSLLGVNNIWADSGDTEVVYRANTKLYIQKKIAEAISALS